MIDLSNITTEKVNPKSGNLSDLSVLEIIKLMNVEDYQAVSCIESQFEKIEKVINNSIISLNNGGRIIYMGAGTSGRLGVLDAVECPPTFGVDYNTVVGLIAGGSDAFVKAKEGQEDCKELAISDLEAININKNDIIIGIAASGRTPYVYSALEYAKNNNISHAAIVCTKNSVIAGLVDNTIEIEPGPEVLTGSTRLKAGTATKLVLNMISTVSMIGIGKVYKNYMVDLKLSNEKLLQRGINIVSEVTGSSQEKAKAVLERANGLVKNAIVMILLGIDNDEATERILKANGHIKNVLEGGKGWKS